MKKGNVFLVFGILLLTAAVLSSGCKKKSTAVVPAFTITDVVVTLQSGGQGLEFYGKCNNDDVKMTKAIVSDPLGQQTTTYNLNGDIYVSNQVFAMQAANTAYVKESGTWTFTFVGNRTADGASFTVGGTLNVGAK